MCTCLACWQSKLTAPRNIQASMGSRGTCKQRFLITSATKPPWHCTKSMQASVALVSTCIRRFSTSRASTRTDARHGPSPRPSAGGSAIRRRGRGPPRPSRGPSAMPGSVASARDPGSGSPRRSPTRQACMKMKHEPAVRPCRLSRGTVDLHVPCVGGVACFRHQE